MRAVWPDDDPTWVEGDIRKLLGRFGLSGEMVFQKVHQLSGGEKAKAALARLCATGANLLVMDEPTNHLDIWSCEALERSILDFEGTVLVVSHDRYFLNKIANRMVIVSDGRGRVVEGDYETYQRMERQAREEAAARAAAQAKRAAEAQERSNSASNAARSGEKRKRRFPYRRPAEIEREIAEVEARVGELEGLLAQSSTWKDHVKAVDTQKRHGELKTQLETLYQHWEEALELNS